MQVLAASALLAVFLMWAGSAVSWTQLASDGWKRVGLLGLVLLASAVIYFTAIWASGLKLRRLLKP